MKKACRFGVVLCALILLLSVFAGANETQAGVYGLQTSANVTVIPLTADGGDITESSIRIDSSDVSFYKGAEKFTVTVTGLSADYYLITMQSDASNPTEDNLRYIDQASTSAGAVAFTVFPDAMEHGVTYYLFLSGQGEGRTQIASFVYYDPGQSSIVITAQPQDVTVAEGGNAEFTVAATGTDLTYQWQFCNPGSSDWKDSPAAGNKTATLTVPATTNRSGNKYRCVVTSGSDSVTSDAATLTVTAGVKITTQPTNATVVEGNNATFKVVASGTNLTYQWQVCEAGKTAWKDSPATGSKTATLTVPGTMSRNGYKYRCVVTSGSTSVTSDAATLTVTAGVKITTQPANATVVEGNNATFKVVASGTSLTYQWQVCEAGKTAWKDSPATGSKTATLTVPGTLSRNGYKYRCVVTSGSNSVTSSAATLTVTAGVKITTQPANATVVEGNNATFKVVASGTNLTYQWQVCEAGKTAWKDSPATGSKTATLTVPGTLSRNGYKYRCVVKSGSNSVTSNAATLTVTASTAPKITAQPKDVTTAAGGNVTFTVTATGNDLTYQWQYCNPGSSTWRNSPAAGNKTATLTIPATTDRSGNKYRCVVTSGTSSVTSDAATLTVVAVTTQPKSVTQAVGSTATFTVKAQGPNLTYQWQVSTNGGNSWSNSPAEGNKTATLTVPVTASRNGYRYRCVVTSGSTTVTSDAATLTVS